MTLRTTAKEAGARNAAGRASVSTTAKEAPARSAAGQASASTTTEEAAARIAGRRRTSACEPDRRAVRLCAGETWCGGVTAGDYNGIVVGGREEERRRRTDNRGYRAVTVCVCVLRSSRGREGGREGCLSLLATALGAQA